MTIWKSPITLDQLKLGSKDTLMEHLGIEYLEIGSDYLKARMPVDSRTKQSAGILHGGASAALAETLGSVAASMCIDRSMKRIVGLEINANHIRPVTGGWVTGITMPIHVGNTTQIWEIRIYNEEGKLVCISRLTVANITR
ncbi:MAG: hotdog fold thioesterase [Desulfuromonadaceae bacterium]